MASSPASSTRSSSPRLKYLSSSPSATLQQSIHSSTRHRGFVATDSQPENEVNPEPPLPPSPSIRHRRIPSPIPIPTPRRDPNRVLTPLSGRGVRQGHLFPYRDTSPLRRFSKSSDEGDFPRSLSPIQHLTIGKMHTDRGNTYYTPTSPLSPNMNPSARPISPQPSRPRARHSPKSSKSMRLGNLPRFHPAVYQSPNQTPGSASDARPNSSLLMANSPRFPEGSTRLMRQGQLDFIMKADISSRIAASQFGSKPDAPRIDPANSPGPVTPLALEADEDYFTVADPIGGIAESPGSRSERCIKDTDEQANTPNMAINKKPSPRR